WRRGQITFGHESIRIGDAPGASGNGRTFIPYLFIRMDREVHRHDLLSRSTSMSLHYRVPLAAAIGLALSGIVSAQDAVTNLDQVIVTGTRASDRTALESTAPIDVLGAEDIRRAGAVNGELGSALQALLPSFNF